MVPQAITGPATLFLEPNWDIHVYSQDLIHSSLTHLCKFLFKYKLSQLYCYGVLFLSLKMPATSKFPKDFSLCQKLQFTTYLCIEYIPSLFVLCSLLSLGAGRSFETPFGWKNVFVIEVWAISRSHVPNRLETVSHYTSCASPPTTGWSI